ncbi:hypothetical protein [Mitsuaria sp. GD03876]|uniref:hypothetical protein n=1 Tax=Mitsuaria sp. GD03876 TaxID=2975399 RepID=UPI00244950B7|nr:hypothetical protein [Mitsuaria sp. GD03876]MDH0863973.1 hypothetical protein [Mitsuaria sp. GD03876]
MNAALPLPGVGGHGAVFRAVARKVGRLWWLALPVLGATGLATMSGKPKVVAVAFAVAAAIALQLMWWAAASALVSLNDPLSARLVPGQVRRLREVAVGLMLVLAVACGALLGSATGHELAIISGCAVAMLAFVACLRWPNLWIAFWFTPAMFSSTLHDMALTKALVAFARDWYQAEALTQTAVVLLLAGMALWRLFQDGGSAHAQSWGRSRRWRETMSMQRGGGAARIACPRGPLAPLARLFQWGHPLWREHLLRTARPTAASVAARADFAVLRGLHWSASGSTSIVILGFFLIAEIVLLITIPDRAERVIRGALPGVSIGLMSSMMAPLFGLATTLLQMRREQALLLLVPGMPRGSAMNRQLAFRLLRQYLGVWAVAVGAVLTMGALVPGDTSAFDARMLGLHAAAVALPAGLLLWRDWSRQAPLSGGRVATRTMAMLLLMGLSGAASGYWEFSPLWTLAASVLLTVAVGAWRWRALDRLAPFWPVGRHGGGEDPGRA